MYIELFLLDNLLMNLLVLHLTAAMLSLRPHKGRFLLFAMGGAAYAAVGAGLLPMLLTLPMKLLTSFLMAFAIPCRSIKGYFKGLAALLLSTLAAGGAVFAISIIFSDDYSQGIALHTFFIGALAVALLPGRIRLILARRVRNESIAEVTVTLSGQRLSMAALVDTGSSLTESISKLPVILLPKKLLRQPIIADAFSRSGKSLPIPMSTAGGDSILQGCHPEQVTVNGASVNAVVAFANVRFAIVPPPLLTES